VQPETRYAWLGRDRIAYQVLGQGPPDLVEIPGSFTHVDLVWEDPAAALFLRRLASFSRLIQFDRLGMGASDPLSLERLPPWESYAEQLAAVLDEVGSDSAVIQAGGDAGSMAMYFAATRPERTRALILVHTTARYLVASDYPIGIPPEAFEAALDQFDRLWGTEAAVAVLVPSRADDERFRRWFAKLMRGTASPRAAQAFLRAALEIDARPFLPLIQAPTLLLHRTGIPNVPLEHGRFLAEHIAGAKLSSWPAPTSRCPGRGRTSPWTTLRSSWLACADRRRRPGCCRRCCSLTSSRPPSRPAGSGIGAGGSCWRCTTRRPGGWWRSSVAGWWPRPAMASWPPLMAPAERSAARPRSEASWVGSAYGSGRGCTLARSSYETATSAGSPCTLPPGSWPRPDRVRS
jgi:pimeloyl-ACP methyl ester carboxylesterase